MKVLVTGGSGFLGRGILRAAERLDWDVTIYSRDEMKQVLCKERYPDVRCVLGDIKDVDRLTMAMMGQELVVHAAAIKFVPEAEFNVEECVAVNVDGTRAVIRAAIAARVPRVVGISTDKAVQPVNVYGMTKALMERLFSEASSYEDVGGPRFTLARYGNVVGSTGSVITLFERQVKFQKKLLVTDPNMTRFWQSVDESVRLICLASNITSGSIAVPKGRSARLIDVAEAVSKMYNVPIEVIGPRPGEKTREELINYYESTRAHDFGEFYRVDPVGSGIVSEPFTLTSDTPYGFVSIDEIMEMIEDAKRV